MPYIPPDARAEISEGRAPETVGELTYVLYLTCLEALPEVPRFGDYVALLGCLEATKAELYRRHVAPYEDARLAEHGDVLV